MPEENELDDGYRTLGDGCGFVERPDAEALEVTGEDRLRFLNGLVTCDVAGLEPGHGSYGFFTGVKGRILADVTVLALEDRLWLELPPGHGDEIRAHCEKYRIVDRVDFAPLERVAVTLLGPRVEAVLGTDLELDAPPFSHSVSKVPGTSKRTDPNVPGTSVRAVREARFGAGGVTLWATPGDVAGMVAALREAGAVAVACEVLDAWRIERGWPIYGVDYGGENFPQETGLGDLAVSYTKGCYLGQEIVARIHYRGGVNRHLRGLRFSDDVVPNVPGTTEKVPGTELLLDGRAVGTVTSAARSPRHGVIGLAILHRRGADPGGRLQLAAGDGEDVGEAEVVELPFA